MTTTDDEPRGQVAVAMPGAPAARGWRPDPLGVLLLVVVVALVPVAVTTDRFLTLDNARAILAATAFVGITAVGATLVMIAGSAVSMAASQTATVVAMVFLSTQDLGLSVALLLSLLCGIAITAVQGVVIGYWEANPIVLTIAAGFAIGGTATWLSGGTTVYAEDDAYDVLNSTVLGLPVAVYVLLVVALVAEWVLRRTTPGRQMFLVGENRGAARAAGLPVGRVIGVAWAFFGLCIAITGVFLASFNTSATVSLGGTLTLDAIAAVLVGGTAITGGRGSALRTLGGAVLISVIANLLLIRGYSTGAQILVKGVLVLVVVVLVHLRSTRGHR
ncbi:ABC transporter permease [Nocardioides conyzicola]|uniref:ABC transporter permease n=1 Tax=Nocardioides conyzicola TaxID=1651781 RepID=A0ABP8XQ79_9ACTN